jgi:lipoprotein-releasing system ATP-binding protein
MINTPSDGESTLTPWISPRRSSPTAAPVPHVVAERTLAEYASRQPSQAVARSATPTRPAGPVQLSCRQLFKSYQKGDVGVPVLQGIDLDVHEGEFLAIIGQSGSGKSTLLHLLATLDRPDAGEINFQGRRIDNVSTTLRDMLRNRFFGMIFQFYHLLPELTAFENILAPAMIAEGAAGYFLRRKRYRQRAHELLDALGLAHRAKHKPNELSGGEMQRAAIARALLLKPRVLLADEPTGNLDRSTGEQIMQTLVELNGREKLTIVMVTHDPWIAEQSDRTVKLVEGRIHKA